MATWIAHLRVAQNLFKKIDGLNLEYFLIGNLGPDLNLQDEDDWETFRPPGDVTHFRTHNEDKFWCSDLDFYRKYLSDLKPNGDPERFSFLLGYFFHLITDNLWHIGVGAPTQARYTERFDADPDFIWEVKRDWYGLDFIYLRNHQDASFWQPFIDSEYNQDYLDFFPPDAIQKKLGYIKSFYQQRDEKIVDLIDRDFVYLSQDNMDQFIEAAGARIYWIYQQLWISDTHIADFNSSLQLFHKEDK